MEELHVLLDYENVQPSLEALAKLAPGFTDVWLFHGPNESKKAQAIAASHARVTLVPHSGKGKNALDFHLSFYLGYVAAKHPDAELVVVANDRGYDPMLAYARMLEFRARRVGYKVPVAKKVAVKPEAPAAVPMVAKKAVAEKVVAKKAATKHVGPKPTAPAKAAAAKKTPAAKKAPVAKKAATKKVVAPKPAKAAQLAMPLKAVAVPQATPEAKTLDRIQQSLLKMGSKAPNKLKPFLRHVGALLGKGSSAEQIDAMVVKLEAAGAVGFIGDKVVYGHR